MNKTDALNDDIVRTKIILDHKFINVQTTKACVVTAPDGFTETFRNNITPKSKDMKMWKHCKCTIKYEKETRIINASTIIINGVQLEQIDYNKLIYSCDGKAAATNTYIKQVKPGLEERGYEIIGHICEPYKHVLSKNNCHDGTMLDPKY